MNEVLKMVEELQQYADVAKEIKDVPPEIGEKIVKSITPNDDFVKYIFYGGEAISIRTKNRIDKEEFLLKIALPFFSGAGKRTTFVKSAKKGDYKIEDRNNFKERFLEGVKLQKRLSENKELTCHAIIPKVHEIADTPVIYAKMEFIDTPPCRQWLQDHTVPVALNIFLKILDFFSELHSWGVIHRDIKPDNILIRFKPVILDWTIAKIFTSNETRDITAPGYAMGSPSTRSEKMQSDAGSATPLDDIYSLGKLLAFFILKSEPRLYPGEDLNIPKYKEKQRIRIRESLPLEFQDIFEKATDVDETSRYQLVKEFSKDLRLKMRAVGVRIFGEADFSTIDLDRLSNHQEAVQETVIDTTPIPKIEIEGEYSEIERAFIKAILFIKKK